MKIKVYCIRNSILEASGVPFFDDHEPDVYTEGFERRLMVGDFDKVKTFENSSLYYLGIYDDESMRFEIDKDPILLVDCNLMLEKRKVKEAFIAKAKEVVENKEENKDEA